MICNSSALAVLRRAAAVLGSALALLLAVIPTAHAVPSFARQTGLECGACHVGSFGPQLTPFGVRFKINGYTESNGQDGQLPLAGMVAAGYTHTARKLDDPPTAHTHRNDNLTVDEVSLFIAGRLTDHLGTFIQTTYDGVEQHSSVDHADLRYAQSLKLAGHDTVLGLSFHNAPGVQDPLNTLPVWSFPFTSSPVGFSGGDAATLFNGGLEHRVMGASAYAFWNDSLYLELGTYRALSPSAQSRLGEERAEDMGRLGGDTAYWRLAWLQDLAGQSLTAGVFGLRTSIQPDRLKDGPVNHFDDVGVDASYQFFGSGQHIAALYGSYIHERQTRDDLFAAGEADHRKGSLNEFKLAATYHYDQSWGLSGARFLTQGNRDTLLYGEGFSNGSPDTSGYVLQADWTPWGKRKSWGSPWANLRLGVQYTMFDRFNGAKHDYDGNGRDAKDNDTLFLFAWTAF